MVGVAGLVRETENARLVIVDGFEGHVLVDPDPALIQVYSLRAEEHRRRQEELLGLAHLPARTLDGHDVRLLANIDLVHEIDRGEGGRGRGDRAVPQRVPLPCRQALTFPTRTSRRGRTSSCSMRFPSRSR